MDDLSLPLDELQRQLILFLPSLISALVIFVVGIYLASLAAKLLGRALDQRRVNVEARRALVQVSRWLLIILVTATALEQVNFDLTAFITGLGILGFTIGFALKDISENFVAGLLLLLQRPFELGDVIEVADFRGRITDVSLRATEMETMDGHNVILPNGLVYTSPILNYTRTTVSRVSVDVGVGYGSDLDEVRRVALSAIAGVPGVLEEPEPFLTFHTFGDSSINFTLYYWINLRQDSYFQAADMAVPVIKTAFERAGIEIPFPIRTVLMGDGG